MWLAMDGVLGSLAIGVCYVRREEGEVLPRKGGRQAVDGEATVVAQIWLRQVRGTAVPLGPDGDHGGGSSPA